VYRAGTWTIQKKKEQQCLETFKMWCWRRMENISLSEQCLSRCSEDCFFLGGGGILAGKLMPRTTKYDFYFSVAQEPISGLDGLVLRFLEYPQTHTCRTPLEQGSVCLRGRYLHNTQQTQETNFHALSGIRTHGPSNKAAAGLCLRPHGHQAELKV
jgi:hypothetical protein